MKHVVSISLGSSTRDHRVETDILGERFLIERIGVNGDYGDFLKENSCGGWLDAEGNP